MTDLRGGAGKRPAFFDSDFCAASRRRLVLIAAVLASALGFIDGTVVAIALPAMRDSLGAGLAGAQWISNAYMLPLGALILVGGAAGDRFGLGRIFAGGIALFVIASLFCAVAPTTETLIAARVAQGIGAAFMVPGSLAIISRTYPREERGRAIGIWAAASAMTTALGPIIGGLVLSFGGPETWRLIFAVNLPLGALALWLLWRSVERDKPRTDRPLDVPGALLATLGLGLVAWALTGSEHGDDTAPQMLPLAVGFAALLAFVAVEARSAHPMVPLALFKSRVFSAANLLTFTLYFGLSALLFYLPMTVIGGWGLHEATVSLTLVPLTVFISAMSGPVGSWADRVGPGLPIGIGAALVAIAQVAIALGMPYQNFWGLLFPAMCLFGLGMGFVVSPLSTAVMGAVDEEASGTASGVNNAVARVAGLIAVAAMGGVAAAAYDAASGSAGFGSLSAEPGHAAASSTAFAAVAWATAGLSALSALVAFFGIRDKAAQTGS
ncbi:MAG: MFS transporter [Pseudomonadota bacterium]